MNTDSRIRLLLVEDDIESGDSMALMLGKRDVDVTLVPSGEEAIELFSPDAFDVVVSDIRLIKMTGVDVLQHIRKNHTRFPVILLTGYDSIESAIAALHQGAQDYILKPLDSIDQLLKPVQTAVDNYRLHLKQTALEQELALSEKRFRKIYENAAVGVMLVDEAGDVIQLNRRAVEMFNVDESVPREINLFDMHVVSEEENVLRAVFSKLKAGEHQIQEVETRFKRSDLDTFWCMVFFSVFEAEPDDGRRFLVILMDVSEKKELEGRLAKHKEGLFQAEKLMAMGKMAGGIAHDFNNILYIITGNLRLAMERIPDGSEEHEKLVSALAACESAVDMTERIYHPGQAVEPERRPLNLQKLVTQAVSILSFRLTDNIEPVLYLDEPDTMILADRLEMQQVIMNLMTNAVQAMQPEGGQLKVVLQAYETDEQFIVLHPDIEPGEYLCFKVADTGCGISQEDLEHIFEPFFTTRRHEGGSGLGLSLIHAIVKAHGGTVDVTSTPGEGSVFVVYLPVADAEEQEDEQAAELPTGTQSILLLDDDTQLLGATEEMLQRLGYKTTSFTDCSVCLEHFREHSADYDLAIIDYVMPTMTGGQISRELLAVRDDLPIIILTAFTYAVTNSDDESSKIRKYISKTTSPAKFAQIVHSIFEDREMGDRAEKTILIIDDNHEARRLLREMLEKASYRILEAPNGKEGVNKYKTHHVDLIITDVFMPDKDGLEVVMECRKQHQDTKIFVFSGGSSCAGWDCLPLAKSLGADKTFRLPVDHQRLLDSVYNELR